MQKGFCAKALILAILIFLVAVAAKALELDKIDQIDQIVESTAKSIASVCFYGHCNQLSDVIVGLVDTNGPLVRAYRNGHQISEVPKGKFGIASLTKASTGLLVQMLADDKKIDLDAPIATYLPRSKSKKDIPVPMFEGKKICLRSSNPKQELKFRMIQYGRSVFAIN